MPKLGLGTPNASHYSNMKPELYPPQYYPARYSNENGSDEDDVSTTAVCPNEEKKRPTNADENPGSAKKSKVDGEDEQIHAALRKSDKQQSHPCKSLPKIFLNMQKDQNYNKIMIAAVKRLDRVGCNGTFKDMGIEVLQSLKQEYDIVDKNGASISEEAALQSITQCIRNQHYKKKQPSDATATTPPAPPAVTPVNTLDSNVAGSDIILDMRKDKTYEKAVNNSFKNGYDDELETGRAILRELQRSLGRDGKFLASNGSVVVDSEDALQKICQSLAVKSKRQQTLDNSKYSSPSHQNRSHESGRAQSQSQEVQSGVQRLTRDKREELLDYFGSSIIANHLKKSDSCGWTFQRVCKGHNDEWIAVKNGYTKKNAEEDKTMLTGVRKIAHWAFREGHFKAYANTDFGRNFLERKGLFGDSYKIIFDKESEELSGSDNVSRRTVSPNSSPRENEDRRSTVPLRGEERREYTKIYTDVVSKLKAASSANDENGKEFFGLLQKCLETTMIDTVQHWHARKDKLKELMREFDDAVKDAAKINQSTGNSWIDDAIIPSIIEEVKDELLGD